MAPEHSLPQGSSHLVLLLVLVLPGVPLGDCATPFCYQCLLHAVVMLHRPGARGAEVGLQHLHSITQPRSG